MKAIEIPSRVENGSLIENRNLITRAVKSFEGKLITIAIKLRCKKRSKEQNAFYWGCWIPIIQEAIRQQWQKFHTENEVHEILKQNCNYYEVVNPTTGEIKQIAKSSTELSTYEWEQEFKLRVRDFVMEYFNIDLPEPEKEESKKQIENLEGRFY